jgi:diguanylate cyclase (GGDEF)-like protein
LIGVVTLHSTEANAFTDDHRRIIDLTSRTLSDTLRRALDFDLTSRRDPLTGLPTLDRLDQLLHAVSINSSNLVESSSLILIDVLGFADITERFGTEVTNGVLLHVVRQVRSGMRASDLLFRSGSDELVAFLPDSDRIAGLVVADRIREHMHGHPLADGSDPLSIELQVTCVSIPDGESCLHELLDEARANARADITLDGCPVS